MFSRRSLEHLLDEKERAGAKIYHATRTIYTHGLARLWISDNLLRIVLVVCLSNGLIRSNSPTDPWEHWARCLEPWLDLLGILYKDLLYGVQESQYNTCDK